MPEAPDPGEPTNVEQVDFAKPDLTTEPASDSPESWVGSGPFPEVLTAMVDAVGLVETEEMTKLHAEVVETARSGDEANARSLMYQQDGYRRQVQALGDSQDPRQRLAGYLAQARVWWESGQRVPFLAEVSEAIIEAQRHGLSDLFESFESLDLADQVSILPWQAQRKTEHS